MVTFKVTDRLIIYLLAGILAVLSTVTIVGNRDAANAAKNAARAAERAEEAARKGDLIAECLTPGTRCAEFRAENERLEAQNVRAQNRCILEQILNLPGAAERGRPEITQAFLDGYDDCVKRESQVAVPDPISSSEGPG